MKPTTTLAQFCKIADIWLKELQDLLSGPNHQDADKGNNPRPRKRPAGDTVGSYYRGSRKLPALPELELLSYHYGVDAKSLVTPEGWKKGDPFPKPRTISGKVFTSEFCKRWQQLRKMEEDEVLIAIKQLTPMIEGTLLCLANKEPHHARMFLNRINATINEAIKQTGIKRDLEGYFERTDLGKTIDLPHYTSKADLERNDIDMRRKYQELPIDDSKWESFIHQLERDVPLTVSVTIMPTLGTPDSESIPPDLPETAKREWKRYGLGSIWSVIKTHNITQSGKTISFTRRETRWVGQPVNEAAEPSEKAVAVSSQSPSGSPAKVRPRKTTQKKNPVRKRLPTKTPRTQ
jgi:hypothetical protein